MTAGTAEQRRLATKVTAALGMEPRLLRLISAVHEAGHAIVGATVGFEVTEARAESREASGSGTGEVTVDFGPGRDAPLSDLLSMKAAGYQASFTWLQGRGIDGAEAPYDFAGPRPLSSDGHVGTARVPYSGRTSRTAASWCGRPAGFGNRHTELGVTT